VWISLAGVVVVYTVMGVITVRVRRSMARRWRDGQDDDLPSPYGPSALGDRLADRAGELV
jgi:cytochrome d ubiquinol oxidase subunit I